MVNEKDHSGIDLPDISMGHTLGPCARDTNRLVLGLFKINSIVSLGISVGD